MSEKSVPELSKVINLILENPRLIEEISRLGQTKEDEPPVEEKSQVQKSESNVKIEKEVEQVSAEISHGRKRRSELLGALKPFLSNERAKAIDSMITIADILEVMKAR